MFFFFNDPATTEIYTLSLHDALPISVKRTRRPPRTATSICRRGDWRAEAVRMTGRKGNGGGMALARRSEEHTSELQSRQYLVCRLLLEKKKKKESNKSIDLLIK